MEQIYNMLKYLKELIDKYSITQNYTMVDYLKELMQRLRRLLGEVTCNMTVFSAHSTLIYCNTVGKIIR